MLHNTLIAPTFERLSLSGVFTVLPDVVRHWLFGFSTRVVVYPGVVVGYGEVVMGESCCGRGRGVTGVVSMVTAWRVGETSVGVATRWDLLRRIDPRSVWTM